jgi:hypothetical protein
VVGTVSVLGLLGTLVAYVGLMLLGAVPALVVGLRMVQRNRAERAA